MDTTIEKLKKSGVKVIFQAPEDQLDAAIAKAVAREMANAFSNFQPSREEGQRFLSVEKTMELTDVSRTTLWHWERKAILKPVKIGRTVKYRYSDVINLIEGKGGQINE